MLNWLEKYKIESLLWFFILAYIVLFSYLSIRRVYTLNSHYYDLGIMDQTVYNTSKGRFLEMTNQELLTNTSRFAIHFDPILMFFAPLYMIKPSFYWLLIIQTIVLGLGAWAIYLIARQLVKEKWLGLILGLSYLFNFSIQRANLFDFHPVVLATTFLLFMIYFSLKKNYWPMLIMALLSLLTKEHVGLIIFLFGSYQFFFNKEKKWSLILIAVGLTFFTLSVEIIIPHFRSNSHFAIGYFGDFGDSPKNILLGLVKNPALTSQYLFKPDTLIYLGRLLLAPGLLLLFSPLQTLISLPELAINILSNNDNMRSYYFHYNSLIVPFFYFAAVFGWRNVIHSRFRKYRYYILTLFLVGNIINVYYFDPLPLSSVKEPFFGGTVNSEKLQEIKFLQKQLKDDQIKLASTPKLAPFFTSRQYYYNFLYDPAYHQAGKSDNDIIKSVGNYSLADYVVVDLDEIIGQGKTSLPYHFYLDLKQNQNYQLTYTKSKLEVYKKI